MAKPIGYSPKNWTAPLMSYNRITECRRSLASCDGRMLTEKSQSQRVDKTLIELLRKQAGKPFHKEVGAGVALRPQSFINKKKAKEGLINARFPVESLFSSKKSQSI